jgi:hypothetical protein
VEENLGIKIMQCVILCSNNVHGHTHTHREKLKIKENMDV